MGKLIAWNTDEESGLKIVKPRHKRQNLSRLRLAFFLGKEKTRGVQVYSHYYCIAHLIPLISYVKKNKKDTAMRKQTNDNKAYKYDTGYNLVVDDDVKAVLSFMQRNIPADKLVAISTVISRLAPCLWSQHQSTNVIAMNLQLPSIDA